MSFGTAFALRKTTRPLSDQQAAHGITGAALCALAACLFAACVGLVFPGHAFAETRMNPCAPTEDEVAAYQADGTLAQRQAFQESLGHESPDSELLQAAIARQQQLEGVSAYAEAGSGHQPSYWLGGCPTVGTAKVLGLRVAFPDRGFAEGDTLEAFKTLFVGGDAAPASFPYESLNAYYERASYGELSFTAECFDYEAKYEIDYYADRGLDGMEELFKEALDTLTASGKLHLSDFDGNEDGVVDAVYLHFACNEDEPAWGSALWSQQWKMEGLTYSDNGKDFKICKVATLHNPSNTELAARTLIHETGHVLGLPDYYLYERSGAGAGANTDRTGILTFDMMFDNKGDHNGFSKWLLGWIGEDRMTHVTAAEDGIRVQSPTGAASYEPGMPFDVDLNMFSHAENGGDIAIVANHDTQGTGMFSSYYVVEYDGCEGNNTVQYALDSEGAQGADMPSGFRIFRVQAQIDAGGIDFVKRNTEGPVHDQLIELVDPDENLPHEELGSYIPSARGAGESGYGCMLFKGSASLTPKSVPVSTNFYENLAVGFTGLGFEALETGGATGTLRISYSDEGKPDPSSFSLECITKEILNVGTVELEASSDLVLATWEQGYTEDPYLIIGGVRVPARVKVDGNRAVISYCINAHEVKAGDSVKLVLPTGMFIVGATAEGEPLVSGEMTFDSLKMGNLTQVESGQYVNGVTQGRSRALSNVMRDDAGMLHFIRLDGAMPQIAYVCTVDPSDIGVMSEVPCALNGAEAFFDSDSLNDATLVATALGQGKIALSFMPDSMQGNAAGEFFVLDLASGSARHVPGLPAYGASLKVGSTLVQMPTGWIDAGAIAAFVAQDDAPRVAYSKTNIERMVSAGEGKMGLSRHVYGEGKNGQTVDIVNTADLEQALCSGAPALDEARDTLVGIPVQATLFLEDPMEYVVGIAHADEGYAAIVQSGDFDAGILGAYWVSFNNDGVEISRHAIVDVGTTQESVELRMQEAPGGSVAFSYYAQQPGAYWAPQHTVFLNASGETLSHVVTYAKAEGAWLVDGSWFNVGWDITASPGAAGSPQVEAVPEAAQRDGEDGGMGEEEPWFDKDAHVRWVHTGVLDSGALDPVEPDPDPSDPGEGEGGGSGEGSGAQGGTSDKPGASQTGGAYGQGSAFAKTNDPMFYPGLVAFCLCCAGAAVLVIAMRNKNRSGR